MPRKHGDTCSQGPPVAERRLLAVGALVLALLLGWWGSLTPSPLPESAPEREFSAGRAYRDIREIARAPHPTGSDESRRVIGYLRERMASLGLDVTTEEAPLHEKARGRLEKWGIDPAGMVATNVIGVLAGRDRAAPAVLLMAHHDTWTGSPGAGDDTAGVAAALEVVRALQVDGPPARDVILALTDGEELGLVGAIGFFAESPLAKRIGGVVNLDARGGGGRVMMYETSDRNATLIDMYRHAVHEPAAGSLAVFVYRLMPNRTDLTIAIEHGVQGFNLAFIGRPGLYHTPLSTPDGIEAGSVQHMGSQALDMVRALVAGPAPVPASRNAVFSDVYGLVLVAYPPAVGWLVLLVSASLLGFAGARQRPGILALGGGVATALAVALEAALAAQVAGAAIVGGRDYYGQLAGLPRLEVWAAILGILVLGVAAAGHARTLAAGGALPAAFAGWWLGGSPALLFGLAITGVVAGIFSPRRVSAVGVALPLLIGATVAQVLAPEATPPLAWPLLAASVVAALVALDRRGAVLVAALVAAVAGGWALVVAHLAFLGVGMLVPAAAGVFVLLLATLLAPLVTDESPTDVRH